MSRVFMVFARPALTPAAVPAHTHKPRTSHTLARRAAWASTVGALLTLSGCYYYYPAGYGFPTYGSVPVAATGAVSTAPNAVPDAQYPGPLYTSPSVAFAVPAYTAWPAYSAWPVYSAWPAWSAWPAYSAWPAWGWGGGWGWGAPAVSFGFSYRSGGGRWRR